MKEVCIDNLTVNPFKLIAKDMMLITAEKEGKVNAMTAAWGGLGVMWGRNVIYVVIRPSRYTKEFVDAGDNFSVCVLGEDSKKIMSYMGSVSGRDEDKIAATGLTVNSDRQAPYFEESKLVLICKKLYAQPMSEEFLTEGADGIDARWYPAHDYHTMYIAEIETMLEAE